MSTVFDRLVEELGLGKLLSSPEPLTGGALHKMWQLTTDKGEYAVKEINPHITEKPTFSLSYECSEKIAELFCEHSISAIAALRINNHFVHHVGKQWFIVYPKINGKIININELNITDVAQIGKIFAQIHNANISVEGVDKPHYDEFSSEHWESLLNQSKNKDLMNLSSYIKKANFLFNESIPILNKNLLITHRDLHHLNVLWYNHKAMIIDWESAGLMNPVMEIAGYGLEWSGIIFNHSINRSILDVLLNAYHKNIDERHIQTPVKSAFYGWLGHCVLGWTEFNLRRSVGMVSNDPNEIRLGKDILETKMIPCLRYISENEEDLIAYLRKGLEFRH